MKSYTIHFIRNALTDENLEGRYIGHTDVEISEEGCEQLLEMKRELVFPPVDTVFQARSSVASKLRRYFIPTTSR